MTTPPPPEDKKQDRVERLRDNLLSPTVDRKKKLGLLKKLVEHKGDVRVLPILREAAAAPANQSLLGYVVRSFGYLSGPEPLAELSPYVAHSSRVVVSNAVKALASIDRKEAVRLAMPVVRGANADTAVAAARVLAERCRAECHAQFVEMAQSPRGADRYAALLYLRFVPPAEAVPVLIDMLRRETEADLYPVIARVIPKMISRAAAGPVEALRGELAAKLAELDAALASLSDGAPVMEPSEEVDPEFPDALLTTDFMPARKRDSAEPGGPSFFSSPVQKAPPGATTSQNAMPAVPRPVAPAVPGAPTGATTSQNAMATVPRPTVDPPAPPSAPVARGATTSQNAMPAVQRPTGAHPASPGPASAPVPVPAAQPAAPAPKPPPESEPKSSAAVPAPTATGSTATSAPGLQSIPTPAPGGATTSGAVPWQRKQLKKQQERLRHITRAFRLDQLPDFTRTRPMLVGSILTVVCYLSFLLFGRGGAVTPRPRVSDIAEGSLGKVGARIKFSGTLIEVNRDYNILLLRDDQQLVVSAYYSDQPVGNFTKGKKVAIEGTIREIKSERAYVVHGITATQS